MSRCYSPYEMTSSPTTMNSQNSSDGNSRRKRVVLARPPQWLHIHSPSPIPEIVTSWKTCPHSTNGMAKKTIAAVAIPISTSSGMYADRLPFAR